MLLLSVAPKSLPSVRSAPRQTPFTSGLFLTTVVLVVLLQGQTSIVAQERADESDIIRVSTDLLLFPVRIKDKNGRAVDGITQKDLMLKDDDHATTGIYLSSGADHVALIFALDQSGSVRDIVAQQQDAAIKLFERFGKQSTIAVLHFADKPSFAIPFQTDPSVVRSAFQFQSAPNTRTAIFDAAAKAVSEYDRLTRKRVERRIVILISDGLDNASRTRPTDVIQSANEKQVSFYVIHLPLFEPRDGRLAVRRPAKGFRDLAEKTGGKYFLIGDTHDALRSQVPDLGPVFQAIEQDLRSQYLLGFYIADSSKDGRKHEFALSLITPDTSYSVGQLGYSRTHKFSVKLKPGATLIPQ